MTACSVCRSELPDGARFCPACGSRLEAAGPELAERKVVTTLFADLVGFTDLGERHDPEDVDAGLRAYYTLARTIIERFGGSVEKFIGDAVVGVFGVPAAHEDDAERAVRAALEIIARMHGISPVGEGQLQVRAAVNTGPALVRLEARLETGEGVLVGDAINTAARLLTEAPPMTVAVGAVTHLLTRHAIVFEQLPPLIAKGKAQPVERWQATGTVARHGAEPPVRDERPMVGREVELAILAGLLDRAIASRAPQYALVTGEAGIGKSRLVREFFRLVDERPGFFCTWRQGRCPPYGEGLAYWALREIASAHAGILADDDEQTIETKLVRSLGDQGAETWMLARLRPLFGLRAAQTDREDSHAAWTRYLEGLANIRPTVIVIEDLHWASEPMLSFLEYLRHNAGSVPLLVVCTARPEYAEAHPPEAEEGPAAVRIGLRTLSLDEASRLTAQLAACDESPEIAEQVARQCGGNPLFAEELARYYADGQQRDVAAPSVEQDGAPAPTSILSLIAARIDSLGHDARALLGDAAVVGQVFWPGAIRAAGRREGLGTREALRSLEEREFIRKSSDTTMAGETPYAFWHALVRDVAYASLTRRDRATRHAGVAAWLEAAATRFATRDIAELLAHHYATAYDLSVQIKDGDLAARLRRPARDALARAGERAFALDVAAAEQYDARALSLTESDDPHRPKLLVTWGDVLAQHGRLQEANDALEEGIRGLRAQGDSLATACALARLSRVHEWMGLTDAESLALNAVDLVTDAAPSVEVVSVLERCIMALTLAGRGRQAIAMADEVLGLCREAGLPEPTQVLHYRGVARSETGDPSGVDDIKAAISGAHREGRDAEVRAAYFNLAEAECLLEGPQAALRALTEGLALAEIRADISMAVLLRGARLQQLYFSGRWSLALEQIADLERSLERMGAADDLQIALLLHGILLERAGRRQEAVPLFDSADSLGRSSIVTVGALQLVWRAAAYAASGDERNAERLLLECEEFTRSCRGTYGLIVSLPEAIRTSLSLDRPDLVSSLCEGLVGRAHDQNVALLLEASLEEREGNFSRAADLHARSARAWRAFGVPYEEAHAELSRGRCLVSRGRLPAARAALERAARIFSEVGSIVDGKRAQDLLDDLPDAEQPVTRAP